MRVWSKRSLVGLPCISSRAAKPTFSSFHLRRVVRRPDGSPPIPRQLEILDTWPSSAPASSVAPPPTRPTHSVGCVASGRVLGGTLLRATVVNLPLELTKRAQRAHFRSAGCTRRRALHDCSSAGRL